MWVPAMRIDAKPGPGMYIVPLASGLSICVITFLLLLIEVNMLLEYF